MSTQTPPRAPLPTEVGTTPTASSAAARLTTAALLGLAAANLVGYLVLTGQPNPGTAAASALPLAAAAAVHGRRRWASPAAVIAVAVTVAVRVTDLSFDLVRPGDIAPFALAAVELLAAGTALTGAAVLWSARRRTASSGPSGALLALAGTAMAAAAGAGLIALSPQGEDTGGLSAAQLEALPVVDMVNYRFEAAQLRAGNGQPAAFRFTNDTDDAHTFAVQELGVDVTVPSGRERVVVLDAPAGEYVFHCSTGSHREDGMEGRLVVSGETAPPTEPVASPVHPAGHSHG